MFSTFLYILALVLVVAKLSGVLAISWFLALLPALIPLAIGLTIGFGALFVLFLAVLFGNGKPKITMKRPTRFTPRLF